LSQRGSFQTHLLTFSPSHLLPSHLFFPFNPLPCNRDRAILKMTTARPHRLLWSPHPNHNQFLIGSTELRLFKWTPEVQNTKHHTLFRQRITATRPIVELQGDSTQTVAICLSFKLGCGRKTSRYAHCCQHRCDSYEGKEIRSISAYRPSLVTALHYRTRDLTVCLQCFTWSPDPNYMDLTAVGLTTGRTLLIRMHRSEPWIFEARHSSSSLDRTEPTHISFLQRPSFTRVQCRCVLKGVTQPAGGRS
jgi:hypothetical protein